MVTADKASFPSTVRGILEVAMDTQSGAVSNQEKHWICNSCTALRRYPVHSDSCAALQLSPCFDIWLLGRTKSLNWPVFMSPTTACTVSTSDSSNGATCQTIHKVIPVEGCEAAEARGLGSSFPCWHYQTESGDKGTVWQKAQSGTAEVPSLLLKGIVLYDWFCIKHSLYRSAPCGRTVLHFSDN